MLSSIKSIIWCWALDQRSSTIPKDQLWREGVLKIMRATASAYRWFRWITYLIYFSFYPPAYFPVIHPRKPTPLQHLLQCFRYVSCLYRYTPAAAAFFVLLWSNQPLRTVNRLYSLLTCEINHPFACVYAPPVPPPTPFSFPPPRSPCPTPVVAHRTQRYFILATFPPQ